MRALTNDEFYWLALSAVAGPHTPMGDDPEVEHLHNQLVARGLMSYDEVASVDEENEGLENVYCKWTTTEMGRLAIRANEAARALGGA